MVATSASWKSKSTTFASNAHASACGRKAGNAGATSSSQQRITGTADSISEAKARKPEAGPAALATGPVPKRSPLHESLRASLGASLRAV